MEGIEMEMEIWWCIVVNTGVGVVNTVTVAVCCSEYRHCCGEYVQWLQSPQWSVVVNIVYGYYLCNNFANLCIQTLGNKCSEMRIEF